MSTLCRAKRKCPPAIAAAAKAGQGNVRQGNKTERVRGFHSFAKYSPATFFCPTHLSAFQKSRVNEFATFRIIGNISEIFRKNSPFPKLFRIYFLAGARPFYRAAGARRRTRSPGGASCDALPHKDVPGGTPSTACETHALPIHFSGSLIFLPSFRSKKGEKIALNPTKSHHFETFFYVNARNLMTRNGKIGRLPGQIHEQTRLPSNSDASALQ
jgi:hypothetical protein